MSLILEALKKSEANRRLGQAPDLGTPFTPVQRGRSPLWATLVIVLSLGIGLWWWFGRGTPAPTPAAPEPSVAAAPGRTAAPAPNREALQKEDQRVFAAARRQESNAQAAATAGKDGQIWVAAQRHDATERMARRPARTTPPATTAQTPPAPARVAAPARAPQPADMHGNTPQPHPEAGQPHPEAGQPHPEAGQPHPEAGQPHPEAGQPHPEAGQPHPEAGQPHPEAGQPHPEAGQPHPEAGQPHPDAAAPQPVPGTPKLDVPAYYDLPFATRKALPQLSMSMHVYAADPKQRFVILDGARMVEGDTTTDRVTLREIRPDGVILEFQGQRFFFPRDGL
jgi:general secretion pathway protein B